MTQSVVHSMALAVFGFRARRLRLVEQAGHAYEVNLVRDLLALGLDPAPVLKAGAGSRSASTSPEPNDENANADFMDRDDDKYHRYVAKLDPNDWKEQDHYRVLGLSKLRHRSSMAQVKSAYRQKVLMYHPDKGKASKNGSRNETIFACIQKAYEQLGVDESLRRAYDSVDPRFDDSVPDAVDLKQKSFYDVLGPFFERHARFSISQPVPLLGEPDTDREDVETFYDFWLHFNSWREFSYKDSEDKSKGEDRWERREIEKQNRIEREKLRKEYLKNLSATVELAHSKDPRVKAFREADKRAKEEEKARKRAEREKAEQERKAAEQAEADRLEQERQLKLEQDKKEQQLRQKAKKALQAERKKVRELCKANDFFAEDPDAKLKVMESVERVCLAYSMDELTDLLTRLETVDSFEKAMQVLGGTDPKPQADPKAKAKPAPISNQLTRWSQEEVQLLIKACNLFPAGSVERWVQVTRYVNEHMSPNGKPKVEKDVIKQAKIMKSMEASQAFANVEAGPSTVPGLNPTSAPVVKVAPTQALPDPPKEEEKWSAEQQKQLEAALKSVDPKDPQRWERIAERVEAKSKKQCMQRYKKLVQLIKEAKQKQAA